MTSLIYGNLRPDGLEYSVTVGMPEGHRSTEFWNTKLITDMEERVRDSVHFDVSFNSSPV